MCLISPNDLSSISRRCLRKRQKKRVSDRNRTKKVQNLRLNTRAGLFLVTGDVQIQIQVAIAIAIALLPVPGEVRLTLFHPFGV